MSVSAFYARNTPAGINDLKIFVVCIIYRI